MRRGHATRSHTADLIIESFAPTLPGALEEAAAALVDSFVRIPANAPVARTVAIELDPGDPESALMQVLEAIIFFLDTEGLLAVRTSVAEKAGVLVANLDLTNAAEAEESGAFPKGIAYSGLEVAPTDGGWQCSAIVDV